MKKYSNIEDLYREFFSDYATKPPAEVWERIQVSTSKQPLSVKGKVGIFGTVVAVVAVVATLSYWGMGSFSSEKNKVENLQEEQLGVTNTPSEITDRVKEEVMIVQNEPTCKTPTEEAKTVFASPSKENAEVAKEDAKKPDFFATSNTPTHNNNLVVEPTNNPVTVVSNQQKPEKETIVENAKIKEKTETVSAKTLPVLVSKDTTVCENSIVKLFVLNAKNIRWSTGENKNTIFVNPSSDEQYSATFTTENYQDTTVFISVKCIHCSELFVPNAFTPNGDGKNDVFSAQSEEEYSYFEMTVYSRDGQQILFTSKDIKQGWDGTYKGVPQPHGSYLYMIRYKDAMGKMHDKKGNVLLILQE